MIEGKIEIVRNMIHKGYDNETISELTALSEIEIKQIRNKH